MVHCYWLICSYTKRINQEIKTMTKNSPLIGNIEFTHVGFEIVGGKHYAYHANGQMEISHSKYMEMQFDMASGVKYFLSQEDYKTIPAEMKIDY